MFSISGPTEYFSLFNVHNHCSSHSNAMIVINCFECGWNNGAFVDRVIRHIFAPSIQLKDEDDIDVRQ